MAVGCKLEDAPGIAAAEVAVRIEAAAHTEDVEGISGNNPPRSPLGPASQLELPYISCGYY